MSNELVSRARAAAAGASSTRPATLDASKVNELVARARGTTAPAERVEKVRVQMTCGATGRPFIAIAERRGAELLLVDHQTSQPGRGSGAPAEALSGEYNIGLAPGWACPVCGSSEPVWSCGCAEVPDALHCGGRRGRKSYCACGRFEHHEFEYVASVGVRGQSLGRQLKPDAPSPLPAPSRVPLLPGRSR
jgi:hypothetical protein